MTLFAAALRLLGLSHAEAGEYLNVRLDTVKSWSAGRNPVPDGIWDELRALWQQQSEAAEAALELIAEHDPDEIAPNPDGPRGKEWPSKGAHIAVLARVVLESDKPLAPPEQ